MQPISKQSHTSKLPADDESLIEVHRDALKAIFPMDAINLNLKNAKKTTKMGKSSRTKLASKASGFLSVLIAIALWLDPAYHTEYHATPLGGRSTITLADQSVIKLNTQTQIAVHRHLRSRRITLAQGQAAFDVKDNAYKPFYVDAGQTQVKVVGTKFEVFKRQQQVTVTVLEGKVKVTADNQASRIQQTYLMSNQQIMVNRDGMTPVKNINAKQEMAWLDGKLIFERTPLHIALAEVQRYHPSPIALDVGAANLNITGVFNSNQTQKMLQLLPNILPVKVITSQIGEVRIAKK